MRRVSLYKILFHLKALLWKSIILLLPPTTCTAHITATLSHDYCANYEARPAPLLYVIDHTILALVISCNG